MITDEELDVMELVLPRLAPASRDWITKLIAEVRRLRELAGDFFEDLGAMGDYQFFKWHLHDLKENPWLEKYNPFPEGSPYFPESQKRGD